MPKPLPSPELLRKVVRYDPITGVLYWRKRTPEMFTYTIKRSREHQCNNWNSRHAEKEAMSNISTGGYRCGYVLSRMLRAHRVAWAVFYGHWPSGDIDHINHIRSDNRIVNLRDVTALENGRNLKKKSNNTSGITGIYWCSGRSRWVAKIMVNRRTLFLGRHKCLGSAMRARIEAERKYGFHGNHGRLLK